MSRKATRSWRAEPAPCSTSYEQRPDGSRGKLTLTYSTGDEKTFELLARTSLEIRDQTVILAADLETRLLVVDDVEGSGRAVGGFPHVPAQLRHDAVPPRREPDAAARNLRLIESVSWPSGCIALTYDTAN